MKDIEESHSGLPSTAPTRATHRRVDDEVEEYVSKEMRRVKLAQSFFLLLVSTLVVRF